MRPHGEVMEEILSQLADTDWASVDLGNGFFIEVTYPERPKLEWPYNVFRDLVDKYIGGYAGNDVDKIALFAAMSG